MDEIEDPEDIVFRDAVNSFHGLLDLKEEEAWNRVDPADSLLTNDKINVAREKIFEIWNRNRLPKKD